MPSFFPRQKFHSPSRFFLASSRRLDSGMRSEGREGEKNKVEERERERGGNACEISFQKVMHSAHFVG